MTHTQTIVHKAESRGFAKHGWLEAAHSFSFASYFNRERMHFGALRVLNDDKIAPTSGFGTHAHDNMEIITIPLSGAIRHKDSTGMEGVIKSGDVQVMSAGSGIAHSEFNASESEELNLLQIWVIPNKKDTKPRYQQATFYPEARKNRFQPVASATREEGSLEILQNAVISLADIAAETELSYKISRPGNGVYLFVIEGELSVNGEKLSARDAIGVSGTNELRLSAAAPSRVVALDVPMTLQ